MAHDPGTLYVRSLRSLKPEENGIYTYQTPNEAGNIIDFNVGLYSTNRTSTILLLLSIRLLYTYYVITFRSPCLR